MLKFEMKDAAYFKIVPNK